MCQRFCQRTSVVPRTWIRRKMVCYARLSTSWFKGQGRRRNDAVISQRAGILYREERDLYPEDLKRKGGGKTSIHDNAEPSTAKLLLLIIVSVNQLSVYGAAADWCQELAQRVEAHSPQSTGDTCCGWDLRPSVSSLIGGCIESHQITNFQFWSPRKRGAATRREIRKPSRRSSENRRILQMHWVMRPSSEPQSVLYQFPVSQIPIRE